MTRRKPSVTARDKVAFYLALVPYLETRGRVSVSEVASHFGVDPEFVRSAVSTITLNGLPGDSGTYQHNDLFDIAWDLFETEDEIVLTHLVALQEAPPRLSRREASALIAGVQYISALPEYASSEAVNTLISKLARGATSHSASVAIERSDAGANLAPVRQALELGRQLHLGYRNAKGESEDRLVDPIRLESVDNNWYLRAWCHLRGGLRTFRLDRMTNAKVTDNQIEIERQSLPLPETLFDADSNDFEVTISLPEMALELIDDYRPTVLEITEGQAKVAIAVNHFAGVTRLVSGLGGLAEIIEPPEARASVAAWAAGGLAHY